MGCVYGKPSALKKSQDGSKVRGSIRGSPESPIVQAVPSRREASFRAKEKFGNGDIKVGFTDKKFYGSGRVRDDIYEMRKEETEVAVDGYPCIASIPKAVEGEQVAAGWPSWLAAVAGEAIEGWLPRKADTLEKLDKIGQGTYSSVYKARDLVHNKIVALKRVRFDNMDPESVKFMAREILILRRLDHPNVVKLEGLVTSRTSCSLYLVFEYLEHDLAGLASLPGARFTEPQIKCYMQQLLRGLDHCHSRGVLHRDIKGSNLLLDNHGILKIADFGLATFFNHRKSIPLTSRVVTLWYRPPELLLGATHYGVSVDMWSAGCILGEIYTGKPIMTGRTEVEQLHKIFKLCGSPSEDYWKNEKLPHSTAFKPIQPYRKRLVETLKDLPATAVRLMETLLSIDPAGRGTATLALNSEFFTTKPFPCDPSSLPKYPPSKEIDAKRREDEARRNSTSKQGDARVKGKIPDRTNNGINEFRADPTLDSNAKLARSMQRRQVHPNPKSQSEQFNPYKESATGFPIDPHRHSRAGKETSENLRDYPQGVSRSGPLGPGFGSASASMKHCDVYMDSGRANLSTLSGLVASRSQVFYESQDKPDYSTKEADSHAARPSESFGRLVRNQGQKNTNFSGYYWMEGGRSSTKEPVLHGHGPKAENMHFSGPLLAQSNHHVDQLLREHDRRIQEAARRARLEKARLDKVHFKGLGMAAGNAYKSRHRAR